MRRSFSLLVFSCCGFLALAICLPRTGHAQATDNLPAEALAIIGEGTAYSPLFGYQVFGTALAILLAAQARVEDVSALPVDRERTEFALDTVLQMRFRLGATFSSLQSLSPVLLQAAYEHDFLTGPLLGGPGDIDGIGLPYDQESTRQELRKAFFRLSWRNYLTLGGGMMTSHWGLGLIANDGAHGWEPGSARFADPLGGDRVLRGLLATGPHTGMNLVVSAFADRVEGDESLLSNDRAYQAGGAAMVQVADRLTGNGYELGAYGVVRWFDHPDGATTDARVLDLYGSVSRRLGFADLRLKAQAEAALIWGETDLGASVEYPTHDLLQMGGVLRIALDNGALGGVLDLLVASGDRNDSDGSQNGLKVDPNFEVGLFLFRHVLAAQSGRAPVTAADPELVGEPARDLDRLPTRGSPTNTLSIFPRLWWRPLDGLELYGGALFALSDVELSDPANSRFAGEVRNALDGDPGRFYGTELDLGVRFRGLLESVMLEAGLEGGVLLPGSALVDATGAAMDPVCGLRALLGIWL
ncbi:MAG: hypothetical protein JW797_15760 [Bradymonadales bacterium]|nr:hypothetical protein [Bradymonadales bacterium]